MKKSIFYFFLFFTLSSLAQKKYAKEIRFINDNDLYSSISQDRYYTNGMFFSYSYLAKNNNTKLDKKTITFQIGHHIYSPFKAVVIAKEEHDRPFAGYLYGSFGINRFYKNETILKTSLQIGIIGPDALGSNLQNFIHDIYGFDKAVGWKYQISNAFAANLTTDYIQHLTKDTSNYFDISWVNNGKLGTVFSSVSTGFYIRAGFKPLEKIMNSIAFGSNLNDKNTAYSNKIESFIFFKPMLNYTFYDATIQGSFLNKNSPVTFELVPVTFTAKLGIRFTYNRFNFGYDINYHTKKLESPRVSKNNFFGTIMVNYQFN